MSGDVCADTLGTKANTSDKQNIANFVQPGIGPIFFLLNLYIIRRLRAYEPFLSKMGLLPVSAKPRYGHSLPSCFPMSSA